MKVAFALPFLQRGYGIEHRTTRLASLLPAGVERALLCLTQSGPVDERLPVVRLSGSGPVERRVAAAAYNWSWFFRVASLRFARYLGPDWIVDAQYHPMTSLRPRGPLVVTWYSVPPLRYASSAREAERWLRDRAAMLEGARRADLVLCISRAVEAELQELLGGEVPTAVLPIGHDPAPSGVEHSREWRRVLSVGRFARHKSHEDTILAFSLARRALPGRELELTLVGTAGEPAYLRSLRALAASVGLREGRDVHFVTDASDRMVALAMGVSDLFVSASRWEGFGMPLVEAQAAGMPAVAYDLWSHPEVLAEREHLVPEGDLEGMAETMVALLSDAGAWQKASERARRFAIDGFSWEAVCARYLELLGRL